MTIIYRIEKNSPLSHDEIDGNFQHLQTEIEALKSGTLDGADGSVWVIDAALPDDATPPTGFRDGIDYYLHAPTGDVYQRNAGVFAVVANIQGPAGAAGADAVDGAAGADGANWYSSAGALDAAAAPAGMRADIDYHLDTLTGDVAQIVGGVATVITNLRGPQGLQGEQGLDGQGGSVWFAEVSAPDAANPPAGFRPDVDYYLHTMTGDVYQLIDGAFVLVVNILGPQGEIGETGAAGADAETWYSAAGALDVNALPAGMVDGDRYLDTATGDVYRLESGVSVLIANLRGSQGEIGETGAAGTDGARWFSGAGAALPAEMVDGDHYLDTLTGDVYEKVAGAAQLRANITGPQGPAGTDASAEVADQNRALLNPESATELFAEGGFLGASLKVISAPNARKVTSAILQLDNELSNVKNLGQTIGNETATELFTEGGYLGSMLKNISVPNARKVTSAIVDLDAAIEDLKVSAADKMPDIERIDMQPTASDPTDPTGAVRYSNANGLTVKRSDGEKTLLDSSQIKAGDGMALSGGEPGTPLTIGTLAYFLGFTASGTWTKPTSGWHKNSLVFVQVWGAGGAGAAGAAGGGGGYAEAKFRFSDLPASVAVTVGQGGVGSTADAATAGGASSFGALLTAFGGAKGVANGAGGGGAGAFAAAAAGKGGRGGGGVPGVAGSNSSASGGDATFPFAGAAGGGFGLAASGGWASYGGGGGAVGSGNAGTSQFGGRGGNNGEAGIAPAGGGGATANGANGFVRIWIVC